MWCSDAPGLSAQATLGRKIVPVKAGITGFNGRAAIILPAQDVVRRRFGCLGIEFRDCEISSMHAHAVSGSCAIGSLPLNRRWSVRHA